MTNLRKVGNYTIGLDIGTGSVGWAVIDQTGELCRFKGKNTWGSRLFPSAEPAADTRLKRGLRRRYDRRRQRLDLLQGFFADEMKDVDAEFFIRLNQSRLWREDRNPAHADYDYLFFNDKSFNEADYYKKFPTVYHLRKYLMESEQAEDIRLIYLAFHNIVKCRGNFLHQEDKGLSARTADVNKVADALETAFSDFCERRGFNISIDTSVITRVISDTSMHKAEKRDAIKAAISPDVNFSETNGMPAALSKAIVGDVAEFADILVMDKSTETKFSFTKEDKVIEFIDYCPDEDLDFFQAIEALYSAYILAGILRDAKGGTLSDSMIALYNKHADDLAALKNLVRNYNPESYNALFRGPKEGDGSYIVSKTTGYTAYILGESKCSQEDLYKQIRAVLDTSGAQDVDVYKQILVDMGEGVFLTKLKTRNNGVIPYQLSNLEEMDAIIGRQGRFHPFLIEQKEKIESLVTFRIPYYVGPLNSRPNPVGSRDFAWSVRREGAESEKIYPWNWEEVIDKDASAEQFIRRMTGKCTYLRGEDVLPRHSLLYEEFCVLNELNVTQWNRDGENFYRFDTADRLALIEEVFKKRKSVSHRAISDWLRARGFLNTTIRGTQDESKFISQLGTYNDFRKILAVEVIDSVDYPMIENLVLWNTIFEDKEILKRKITNEYQNRLTDVQINQVCAKRYSGWGRLSHKLLFGIEADVDGGAYTTVIDIMREYEDANGRPLSLMEILNKKEFKFSEAIEKYNAEFGGEMQGLIADLPGSPALKRAVGQSLRIVDELVSVVGHAPTNICIEFTRGEDEKKKGKRTDSRYKRLKEAYEAFKKDAPDFFDGSVFKELSVKQNDLDDRLVLYFSQMGKCLYSGEPLDINLLYTYHVDHILPQCYIKDDSFDNKALVKREHNERKLDSLLLDDSIIRSQLRRWRALHDAGLMSDKKFNCLTRTQIKERQLEGFINRQLVETSQIVKNVATLLRSGYPDTRVVPMKAGLSSALREKCGYVKCREVNDYHHAHDAYLACQLDRFINCRYPKLAEGFDISAFKRFVRKAAHNYNDKGDNRAVGSAGFIVESFLKSGFDPETGEIFRDDAFPWNAEAEIEHMRQCFSYKDCFISRMPEITSGAFWDETIYSPKDPRKGGNLEIPLKKGLDPKKYGGPSGKDFAYFFIFKAVDSKGKEKVFF